MNSGFIKLNRSLIDWEWYKDVYVKSVYLHLLLIVNFRDKKQCGIDIKNNQILTSIRNLSIDLNISPNTISKSLKHLLKSKNIKIEIINGRSLITLLKKCAYFDTLGDTVDDTVLKERKESNKEKKERQKNDKKEKIYIKKEVVFKKPTIEDIKTYISLKNYLVDAEKFFSYYESNGWKVGKNHMRNWKAAISTWNRNEIEKQNTKNLYKNQKTINDVNQYAKDLFYRNRELH